MRGAPFFPPAATATSNDDDTRTHSLARFLSPRPSSAQLQCNSTLAAAAVLLPIREKEEEKLRKKRDRSKVFSTLIRDRRRIRVRPKDSD